MNPAITYGEAHGKMRSFLRLPIRLKRIAIVAAITAPRVKRRLNTIGFEATIDWLKRRPRRPIGDMAQSVTIARIAQAAIRRAPGSYNCLTRSVTVWWLLGGDGRTNIRFGVGRKDGTDLVFHAWVERDEVVINDAADIATRYAPFSSAPPPGTRFD